MILIVHFGAQYAQLIRRAVHELGARATVVQPADIHTEPPAEVSGVILSGSPDSVNEGALTCVRTVLSWNAPVLGICFGHQVLVAATGGTVAQQFSREYGRALLYCCSSSRLFRGLPATPTVWMSHGDTVVALPPGPWQVMGFTNQGQYAAIANDEKCLYGVQFHPEVSHTEGGTIILRNFVIEICGAPIDNSPKNLATELIAETKECIGNTAHVLVACSLGVDSTTVAALCTRALGTSRVHPVFVDNGLQREEDLALARRARVFLPNLRIVEAQWRFLNALAGISDREEKRRTIGRVFWEVFRDLAGELRERVPVGVYAQGTLAPDIIESGAESAAADVIKTHHNLVPPPDDFPLRKFEPLRSLYKDEVRTVGRALDVPEEILTKHPFPGPGLAVRILGFVTQERVRVARACDTIFTTALREHGYYDRVSQAFFVLGSDRVVGVRGDARVEGWVGNLRAVVTRDFMTCDVAPFPPEFLPDVADAIVNRVPEVARVTYDVTRKPPATVEWE